MNSTARKEIVYYFAPGKKLFQIVVKIADEPGSLGRVLNLLRTKVNLVASTSYTLPDKVAIVSSFAEALSPDETAADLRNLIMSSGAVLDAEVSEGKDGMLVDTFHSGLETGGEYLLLLGRRALTQMMDSVYSLLGSGGEVVLFQEGIAVGRANGEAFVRSLGEEKVRKNVDYLRNNLAAQGWGKVETDMETAPEGETSHLTIHDCFECSSNEGKRTGCHFFRGYIIGNRSVILGKEFVAKETKCRLKGQDVCEFLVQPKAR